MKYLNDVKTSECLGKVLKSKNFGAFKVVDVESSKNITVEFLDTGYRKNVEIKEVKTGSVKDLYRPTIFGVGFCGEKYPLSFHADGKCVTTPEYERWRGMLRRCYSEAERHKNPTYKGCTVSEKFKSYEFFYEWYNKQVGCDQNWCLDKDLLVKGNKHYSEESCVLLPYEINTVLVKSDKIRGKYPIGVYFRKQANKFVAQINKNTRAQQFLGFYETPEQAFQAYKVAKEEYLKELAEKWKGQIDDRAYQALINYEVEITD